MRILVTGSSGFVGGAIADHLAAAGHNVVGLDVCARSVVGSRAWSTVIADIASSDEITSLCRDVEPCDAIIHAAACLDMNLYTT